MAANLQFKSTPVRERVSKEEWEVRVDLAAAYQLASIFKWTDLIYTHFSARVPGTENFLINPYGLMFDEITASTLVKIDLEGVALYAEEKERMAASLGKTSKAMILRNHGVLALGETVREAFEMMYYLDCACQIQVDALAGGLQNVQLMTEQAAQTSTAALKRPMRPAQQKDWPALLRMLERRGIKYAQ